MQEADHQFLKKLFLFLTCTAGMILIYSWFHRFIDIDDAWLGEQSFWLSREGIVRSELFFGRAGYEEQMVIYHKFWIILGAVAIKLGGWSVFVLKSLGAFSLAGLAVLIVWILRRENHSYLWGLLAILLLMSHHVLAYYSFTFRPEIFTASLGLISFVCLRKADQSGSARYILAGVFAGLAAFTHLNGLIFILAGVGVLWLGRKWKAGLLVGLGSLLGFAPFLWDIPGHPDLFFQQLELVSAAKQSIIYILIDLLFRVVYEQIRYLHSPAEISFTLLLGFAVYLNWKTWRADPEKKQQLIYTGLLMAGLTFLAPDKTTKYSILLLPFFILLITEAFFVLNTEKRTKTLLFRLYGFVMISFLLINWGFTIWKAGKNYEETASNQAVIDHFSIPPKTGLIAPVNFVFPAIEAHTIKGLTFYEWQARENGHTLSLRPILADAVNAHYEYIILPEKFLEKHQIDLNSELPPAFQYLGEKDGFHVLKNEISLMATGHP